MQCSAFIHNCLSGWKNGNEFAKGQYPGCAVSSLPIRQIGPTPAGMKWRRKGREQGWMLGWLVGWLMLVSRCWHLALPSPLPFREKEEISQCQCQCQPNVYVIIPLGRWQANGPFIEWSLDRGREVGGGTMRADSLRLGDKMKEKFW